MWMAITGALHAHTLSAGAILGADGSIQGGGAGAGGARQRLCCTPAALDTGALAGHVRPLTKSIVTPQHQYILVRI